MKTKLKGFIKKGILFIALFTACDSTMTENTNLNNSIKKATSSKEFVLQAFDGLYAAFNSSNNLATTENNIESAQIFIKETSQNGFTWKIKDTSNYAKVSNSRIISATSGSEFKEISADGTWLYISSGYYLKDMNNEIGVNSTTQKDVNKYKLVYLNTNFDPTGLTKLSINSVTASSHDGNIPANTLDGNFDTRWSAQGNGQWIDFDLGSVKNIDSVRIAFYKGNTRTANFSIQASEDGVNYLTVDNNLQSSGFTLDLETFKLNNVNARFLRIVGYGNTSNDWNSITEVEIWSSDNTDPPVGTANYPSDLMDNYKQWKITLPTGIEIKNLYQVTNEFFLLNQAKNGIVFKAPIRNNNGTTPNSKYIRSELRERTADGKSDIYWTTSGKHVVYVKQAITHLPIRKPHLVATQIHGNKSEGIDDAMVLRLENKNLFLSFNGGKLRSNLPVKTNYKDYSNYTLGTIHEVIFEVIDGKHMVYFSDDGKLSQSYSTGNAANYDKYAVRDNGSKILMNLNYGKSYFKIGNYTQSNPEKEGSDTGKLNNYGEVVVYDFYVIHR